jgi:beta-lactam-binding protein with PASTA domain
VALVVSAGPEPRTIPDGLVGRPVDQATAALKGLGLGVLNTEDYSDTIAAGSVIAVKPGVGEKAAKGSVVNLTVSKGPPVVDVPDVRARPVLEAAAIIEAAGLQVNGIQGSPTRPVSKTNPAVGTSVRRGTSISLITA